MQILKADEKMHSRFCKMTGELLAPIAASVGWEPKETDGHSGKLLRATVIELLATWVCHGLGIILGWGVYICCNRRD